MHGKDKKTWMRYCLEKFITNCDKGLLQIARAHFITNCDRYYKLRRPLLQIATVHREVDHITTLMCFKGSLGL